MCLQLTGDKYADLGPQQFLLWCMSLQVAQSLFVLIGVGASTVEPIALAFVNRSWIDRLGRTGSAISRTMFAQNVTAPYSSDVA